MVMGFQPVVMKFASLLFFSLFNVWIFTSELIYWNSWWWVFNPWWTCLLFCFCFFFFFFVWCLGFRIWFVPFWCSWWWVFNPWWWSLRLLHLGFQTHVNLQNQATKVSNRTILTSNHISLVYLSLPMSIIVFFKTFVKLI